MNPKKIGKRILCSLLEAQVKRLRAKNNFQIVAVAGSVGKTSTKLAIAQTLGASKKVQYQIGNYNDRLTVPLVLFGQVEPSIFNIFAWLKILWRNERIIARLYPYKYAVLELGSDGPGQLKDFAYLQPELTVITAVSEEHMEFFQTIDAVAAEELAPLGFSKQVLVNADDIEAKYLQDKPVRRYGFNKAADFHIESQILHGLTGQTLNVVLPGTQNLVVDVPMLGQQGAKIALAAISAAHLLGFSTDEITNALAHIQAVPGRMQILSGIENSTLIDDTYNSSPLAATAALDVLYAAETPQRIAILGSMNEMGQGSAEMHREVGAYCDPSKLDLVLTIGVEANEFLAPAAEAKGCQVVMFNHPLAAGEYAKTHLQANAVVLAKGSQNGVYAEEALVPLLADKADTQRLVRQSAGWQSRKLKTLPPL